MSVRAYAVEEKEIDGRIWKSAVNGDTFSLWGLSSEEEALLIGSTRFFETLNEDNCGVTWITEEDIEDMKESAKAMGYTGDLIEAIERDFKEYGDEYSIEYRVF